LVLLLVEDARLYTEILHAPPQLSEEEPVHCVLHSEVGLACPEPELAAAELLQ